MVTDLPRGPEFGESAIVGLFTVNELSVVATYADATTIDENGISSDDTAKTIR